MVIVTKLIAYKELKVTFLKLSWAMSLKIVFYHRILYHIPSSRGAEWIE